MKLNVGYRKVQSYVTQRDVELFSFLKNQKKVVMQSVNSNRDNQVEKLDNTTSTCHLMLKNTFCLSFHSHSQSVPSIGLVVFL